MLKTDNNKQDFGLVSIIMPNFNSAKFINETVDSVINQSYKNWELIIVDDCSTDNSIEILSQYTDDRIRLIKSEQNYGAALSRNKAIEAANGSWIAFLDSDDLWAYDKLEKHLSFMVDKSAVFSCTDYKVIDGDRKEVSQFSPKKDEYFYNDILKHNCIGCSTAIYDAKKLGKVYMPLAEKREDFACWLEILKRGYSVCYFHEFLAEYRVHGKSVSSKKSKMIKHQWNVYRKFERLSIFKSAYYMLHWALKGFFKYLK